MSFITNTTTSFNKPTTSLTGISGMGGNSTGFNTTFNTNANNGLTTNTLSNPLSSGLSVNPMIKPNNTFNQGFTGANIGNNTTGFNMNPGFSNNNILGSSNENKSTIQFGNNNLISNPLSTNNNILNNSNKQNFNLSIPSSNISNFGNNFNNQIINQNYNQNYKVLTISPNNTYRYTRFSTFGEQLIKMITNIELKFKNNEILIDSAEAECKEIVKYYKSVTSEAVKLYKFAKLINLKTNKILQILKEFKITLEDQQSFYEKSVKTFNILSQNSSVRISVPGEYFILLVKELEERAALQVEQLSGYEAIINAQNENNESTELNSNFENIMKRLYDSLINLAGEIAETTEYLNNIKRVYAEFVSLEYGIQESDLETRYKNHVANDRAYNIFKQ